jgi:isoleucyl-tRNA synthetase
VRNSRDRFNDNDVKARKTLRYVLEKLTRVLAPILPFASEKIYQDINGKDKSVHLESWPEFNKNFLANDLERDMELTREIVSNGLRQRDQNKMGLKWPLQSVSVSYNKELNKELQEIIKQELNVKDIDYNIGNNEEVNVELNFNLTPELEAEGYARELSRKVQAKRKKLGLNKEDSIKLRIYSDKLKDILSSQIDFLKERTGSSLAEFIDDEKDSFENKEEFKIKEFSGIFSINLN